MASRLVALRIESDDPAAQARFWGGFLGWEAAPHDPDDPDGGPALLPDADAGFRLRFTPAARPRSGLNQMHFDLTNPTDQAQLAAVDLALALGATHLDVGQRPEEGHIVLADPEGNEFCNVEAGNNFLAGCGRIGALSGDGGRAVGVFWSAALDWPLVWDQDDETAVQSPTGGPKLTWGGEPDTPRPDTRFHLELAPSVGAEHETEVERLVGLGATRVGASPAGTTLADPGGTTFVVRRAASSS